MHKAKIFSERLYCYRKAWMIMDKNMAERLTELREKNQLSQTAVANRIGVTPALISAYEKTERNPSIDKLISLADIYHTSTDYILGRSLSDPNSAFIEVTGLSDTQIRIIRELVEEMKSNS
jgi:transcriptional regulator with XRE-family HTH domain